MPGRLSGVTGNMPLKVIPKSSASDNLVYASLRSSSPNGSGESSATVEWLKHLQPLCVPWSRIQAHKLGVSGKGRAKRPVDSRAGGDGSVGEGYC